MFRLLTFVILFWNSAAAQVVKINLKKKGVYYYNHTQVGRPEATREHGQDTLLTPASCGSFPSQPFDSVYCFNVYNNYLVGGLDKINNYPLAFTIDTRVNANFSRFAIYIGSDGGFSPSGKHLRIMIGTPYVWEDTIYTLTDNGSINNQWHKFTVPNVGSRRFIHFEYDGPFSPTTEFIPYGTIIDTIPDEILPALTSYQVDTAFGANLLNGMGDGYTTAAPATRDNLSKKLKYARQFEYGWYQVDTTGEVPININRGFDASANIIVDTLLNRGVILYAGLTSLTTKSMWRYAAWNPYTAALIEQKPIPYTLAATGDTSSAGRPQFSRNINRIAETSSSYAYSGLIAKRLAIAHSNRPTPIKYIGLTNEVQGPFQSARFNPDEMERAYSAWYDGDEGRVTYLGQSVGVKNSGTNIKVVGPDLDVYNLNFLKTMGFSAYWRRNDHKLPFDVASAHDYSTDAGALGQAAGRGSMPESNYKLRERMIEFSLWARYHNMEAWNNENGYDVFDSVSWRGQYCETAIFGNSFMNTPHVWKNGGQTIEATHGNMIARTMLIMRSANVRFFYFWLADQGTAIKGRTCNTFNKSGLLEQDTIVGFVPTYRKRPAYYYFRSVDSLLLGHHFLSDTLIVSGTDSVRIQKYRSVASATKVYYVVWSPTVKNAAWSYNVPTTNTGDWQKIMLTTSSEAGSFGASGSGYSIPVTVTETPLFLYQVEGSPAPSIPTNVGIIKPRFKIW